MNKYYKLKIYESNLEIEIKFLPKKIILIKINYITIYYYIMR